MVDNSNVIIDLEVKPSEAVREVNRLSTSLIDAIRHAKQLETTLNGLNAAQLKALQMQARQIATGGPDAMLRNAGMQGLSAKERADPARQIIAHNREINKTLQARRAIYEQLRATMPPEATAAHRRMAYRAELETTAGLVKGTAAYKKHMSDTLRESKRFDQMALADKAKFNAAQLDAHNSMLQRREHLDAAHMERDRARRQRLQAADARAESRARDRMVSGGRTRFTTFDYNQAQAENRRIDARRPSAEVTRERAGRLGEYAMLGGGLAAILGSVRFAGRSVVQMETALKKLQAITQATDLEMKELSKTVYAVGQNSAFSAVDIAGAATIMGQAGYSVQQVAEALPAVAALATGAGASMGDAVGIVTSTLAVFEMSIERSTTIANQLAQALNGSKLELGQLTLGLQYAGNISAQSGVQFEELTSALGAMAQSGIKSGSMMGTGLRAMIQQLDNPTAKLTAALTKAGLSMEDVNIRSQGLYGVMENLNNSSFRAAGGMGAFDIRARNAFAAISGSLPTMKMMQETANGTTAAIDAAAVQMNSFTAQVNRMKNAVTETTSVAGAPLLNLLKNTSGLLADLLTWVGKFPGASLALSALLTLLTAIAATAAGGWVLKLAGGFLTLGAAAGTGAVGVTAFGTAVKFMLGPIGLISIAITALVGIFGLASIAQAKLTENVQRAKGAAHDAAAKMSMYQSRMAEVSNYVEMLTDRHDRLANGVDGATRESETATRKFGEWGLELDKSGGKVDDLIRRLINLKGELAGLRVAEGVNEITALGEERASLVEMYGKSGVIQSAGLLTNTPTSKNFKVLQEAGLLNLLKAAREGPLSINDANALASGLRRIENKLTPDGQRASKRIQTGLNGLTMDIGRNEQSTILKGSTNALGMLESLPEGQRVEAEAKRLQLISNAEKARIEKLPEGERQAARVAFRADSTKTYAGLTNLLSSEASKMVADPVLLAGLQPLANQANVSPLEMAMRHLRSTIPAINELAFAAGHSNASETPKTLKAQSRTLATQMQGARRTDPALYRKLKAEKDDIDQRLIIAENPDSDPEEVEALLLAAQENSDAAAANALARGGNTGNKAARQNAKTLGLQVKDLERQIKVGGANSASQDVLKGLLDQWRQTSEEQIRQDAAGSGASQEDLQDRLDAFKSDAEEYTAEILNGSLAAAAKLMAEASDRTAANAAGSLANQLRAQGGDLSSTITNVQEKTNDALAKALEASDAEMATRNIRPDSDAAVEERRRITEEFAGKVITNTLKVVDGFLTGEAERQAREIQGMQARIDSQRVGIAALSNSYGSRNISDVQRYLGSLREERLGIDEAKVVALSARQAYGRANIDFEQKQGLFNSTPEGAAKNALGEQMRTAAIEAERFMDAAIAAENVVREMTEEVAGLGTWTETIAASWQAFADQANINKPIMASIADGMTGVFEASRGGLQRLISDTLTGTRTMKGAFKDLSMSILGSLMDMIAKILANKLLTWGVQMLASSFAGPSMDMGAHSSWAASMQMSQGGKVPRRMAGGGAISGGIPNRDSVHINAMPGEVIMSKSSVDMIGVDKLLALNALGNRRMSAMPTVADAVKRAPDETNVWIVAPETKPTLGKRDVLAIINDDMLTGGQTKRLVKQIMSGAS